MDIPPPPLKSSVAKTDRQGQAAAERQRYAPLTASPDHAVKTTNDGGYTTKAEKIKKNFPISTCGDKMLLEGNSFFWEGY